MKRREPVPCAEGDDGLPAHLRTFNVDDWPEEPQPEWWSVQRAPWPSYRLFNARIAHIRARRDWYKAHPDVYARDSARWRAENEARARSRR